MQLCGKCNRHLDEGDFYKNQSKCKQCCKIYYLQNRERLLIMGREYKKSHRKEIRDYYRVWYAKNGRSRAEDYAEKIRIRDVENPCSVKARQKLAYSIRVGRTAKAKNCEECGEERKVVGHHQDYDHPLEVNWLCHSCHKLLHNGA